MSEVLTGAIVAGVDGRPEGLDALALAERLAALGPAALVVVAAYPFAPLSSRLLDGVTDAASARLALEAASRVIGARHAEMLAVPGSSPGRTLHEVAEERGAGCIVVGSSHHGPPGRLVLGGVTAEALRRAPCAVAVAPRGWAGGPRTLTRIGVAVDGSVRDGLAVDVGRRIAGLVDAGADARTIHVEPAFRRAGGRPSVEADVQLQGEAADALAACSRDLDLLILGSRGRGRLAAVVLGSVAARLVGFARCPVLVLPSRQTEGPGDAVGRAGERASSRA
jgi:nucleotide-binding universal stress UspA family protein